jgi:eukaryotic-like serine/threonine-protein kinase
MEIRQIGRYEIQHRLGKGGMGSLYLARDPDLDRLVAIKLLKDDYLDDQELRERFAREARALARLRHPNIVVVYDFGEHEGRPFMAMEYIDGETLRQRLARTPPLKLAHGLALIEDLCAGLANAHDAGIVHRDIKPDNIMINRQGVLKLLDFGIARNAHAESTHQMTQPGVIMGTYNYMSAEQLLGEMVDKRSDIFAVGAVLYQVIAREQAFPGGFGAVYHRVLTTGPVPLEERVPGVDPSFVRIVMRALERDPQARYQDANDMRQELARARQRLADPVEVGGHETIVVQRAPSSRRQKDSEAKRGLVLEQLRLGREAFARGDHDIALQYGERAAFVDPDNATAIELINKSRVAIDAKSVLLLLEEANRLLSDGRIPEALSRAEDAMAGVPELEEAAELRQQVRDVLDQIASTREREDRINTYLERARRSFERSEYETALRAVYEVLALDPDRVPARELEQRAKIQLQAQREHQQARREAHDRIRAARALADEGQLDEAADALTAIRPPSDSVRAAVADALAVVERMRRSAQADAAVAEARTAVVKGHFTHAVRIIDAIPADDLGEDAQKVRAAALELLARERELQEKRQRLEQLLASADASINAGEVGPARDRLAEAAKLALDDHRFDVLSRRLEELIGRIADRHRKEALDHEAAESVRRAWQLFASNPRAAVALLEESHLTHPDVVAALGELRRKLAQIEERARQEREEARRAAEAARLREQQRMAAERLRQENDAREREQQRVIDGQQLAETQIRGRDEDLTATVVRPARTVATQPVQALARAAASTRLPLRSKALVAAAAIVVLAAGSWIALSLIEVDEPGRPDSAPASPIDQSGTSPGQQADSRVTAPPEVTLPPPQPPNPPADIQKPNQETLQNNNVTARSRQQEDIAKARTAIQAAMTKGDLELSERLLLDSQRRFGADNFGPQSEALNQLRAARKDEEVRTSVRELVEKSRQQRDHQAAIGLLNQALKLSPGDSSVQAELRRRNEALTAETRQRELDDRERQAQEQRQRQDKEREDGLKNAQSAIDRALARSDVDGAETLLQEAERRYGVGQFGPQRQQLTLKREQAAAAADSERVRAQIRGVLDRFAQAYNAKDDAGLAAAWPSVPRASYRSMFNSFESLSWVFSACDIDVAGVTATARCSVALRRVDVRGRVTSESGRRRFSLQNQNGAWRIEDMQVQ